MKQTEQGLAPSPGVGAAMMTSTWPPGLQDGLAMVRAYTELLSWSIFLETAAASSQDEVERAIVDRPHLAVATACAGFDAVLVPSAAAMDALVTVERHWQVPNLRSRLNTVTFLVAPGSGRNVADLPGVQVLSGKEALIQLPPTAGVRWDTPPWRIGEPTPVQLRAADELRSALVKALQLYPAPEVRDEVRI